MTRQPIFTTAKAFKPQKDTDPDWSASTLTHNFVVLINTGDPNIKSMFDEAFERAEQYLNEGKNFRIKVSSDQFRNVPQRHCTFIVVDGEHTCQFVLIYFLVGCF